MSVAEEITRIKAAKQSLKTAINAKGGTLTDELIDQYPAAVENLQLSGSGGDIELYRCVDSSARWQKIMCVSYVGPYWDGVYDPTGEFTEDWEGRKYPVYKQDLSSGQGVSDEFHYLFYSSDTGQWCLADEVEYTSGNYSYYGSIGGTWYNTVTYGEENISVQEKDAYVEGDGTWSGKRYRGSHECAIIGTHYCINITIGNEPIGKFWQAVEGGKDVFWDSHSLTYYYIDSNGYVCISDDYNKDYNNARFFRGQGEEVWRYGSNGSIADIDVNIQTISPAFFLFDDKVTSGISCYKRQTWDHLFEKHKVYSEHPVGYVPPVFIGGDEYYYMYGRLAIFDMPCDEAGTLCEGLTFYASLKEDLEQAETGQKLHNNGVEITTFRNVRCAGFDGDRRTDLRPEWTGLPMANNGSIAPFTMCLTFCATKIDGQRYLIRMYNYFEIYVHSTDQGKVLWINAPGISNFQYVIDENKWYTLSVQRTEKGDTIVYLGSTIIAYGKSTGTNTQATYLCLGSYGSGDNAFTGYMTDFRIYNRVLSRAEIILLKYALDFKLALSKPSLIPIGFTSNTSMEGFEIDQSGDVPAFEVFNNKLLCPDCAFVSEMNSAWISINLPFAVSSISTYFRGLCNTEAAGTLYGSNDGDVTWHTVGTFYVNNNGWSSSYKSVSTAGYSQLKWVFEKRGNMDEPIRINGIDLFGTKG